MKKKNVRFNRPQQLSTKNIFQTQPKYNSKSKKLYIAKKIHQNIFYQTINRQQRLNQFPLNPLGGIELFKKIRKQKYLDDVHKNKIYESASYFSPKSRSKKNSRLQEQDYFQKQIYLNKTITHIQKIKQKYQKKKGKTKRKPKIPINPLQRQQRILTNFQKYNNNHQYLCKFIKHKLNKQSISNHIPQYYLKKNQKMINYSNISDRNKYGNEYFQKILRNQKDDQDLKKKQLNPLFIYKTPFDSMKNIVSVNSIKKKINIGQYIQLKGKNKLDKEYNYLKLISNSNKNMTLIH